MQGSSLPRGDSSSLGRPWTPEEAAEFAARRDFRLVQLLSMDRSAFRTARRLGLFATRSTATRSETRRQMQGPAPGQGRQRQRRDATPPQPEAQPLNSAQRRSARRREKWWAEQLAAISAGTMASHARSTSMVQEIHGLLHEIQHAGVYFRAKRRDPGIMLFCSTPRCRRHRSPLTLTRLLKASSSGSIHEYE